MTESREGVCHRTSTPYDHIKVGIKCLEEEEDWYLHVSA